MSQKISEEQFKKMRKAYKDKNPNGSNSVKFERNTFEELMNSDDVAGVRVFFGENDEGQDTVMLVGTNAEGTDLLENGIFDYGKVCPPFC